MYNPHISTRACGQEIIGRVAIMKLKFGLQLHMSLNLLLNEIVYETGLNDTPVQYEVSDHPESLFIRPHALRFAL